MTEKQKTERAMAALDTMATTWAMSFNLREGVKAMMALPDGEDRLVAFIKHCYGEGLYEGRTSHQTTDGGVTAAPQEGVSDEFSNVDHYWLKSEDLGRSETFVTAEAYDNLLEAYQQKTAAPQPPASAQPLAPPDTGNVGAKDEHLFEFWWAEYMSDASRNRAWEAWLAAPRSDGVGVVGLSAPAGYKVLKDSTQQERSWTEDARHENGNYHCVCCHCGRGFIGHKRRASCKVCSAALPPPGRGMVPMTDEKMDETLSEWDMDCPTRVLRMAGRAVERAHGIKEGS